MRPTGPCEAPLPVGAIVCGMTTARSRPVPVEIIVVWAVMLVVFVEVLVAYTRTKPNELIGVPRTGLSVAVTDAIGFLAFPVGLVAIGVAIAIGDGLSRVGLWVAIAAAVGLAVVSLLPGVAEPEEVEITLNPQRVVAAAAVLALFGLTLHAVRVHGAGRWGPRSRGDLVRLVLAAGITVRGAAVARGGPDPVARQRPRPLARVSD